MASPLDVLCVADLCLDFVVTGDVRPRFGQVEQYVDDYSLEAGGSGTIFAAQYVRLGGCAGILGAVGRDAFGEFLLEKMNRIGVDISRVTRREGVKTGLGLALSEANDRAILTYSGTIDGVEASELKEELLGQCRHWHLASFFLLNKLRSEWVGWLKRARARGVTTSLDTNWDPSEKWQGVEELLPHVNVFIPNEAEALKLTGKSDAVGAGKLLAKHGCLVVIKRGPDGAMAFDRERVWEVPDPADVNNPLKIVDTTGAGDSFDGGFIRAWNLKKSVEECLRWGMRCGRASLAGAGGIESQLRTPIA